MKLPVAPLAAGTAPLDVVAVGECSLDFVGTASSLPRLGGKGKLDHLAVLPGGQAATAAVGCARLGWRTRYVGVLGRDLWGKRIEAVLLAESVELVAVWREDTPTRTAVVLVAADSGERTVLSHRAPALTLGTRERPVAAALVGRVLLVDAVDPGFSAAAARAARARGIPTIVDVDQPGSGVEPLLAQADMMVVAEGFPEAMTGASSVGSAVRQLMERFRPSAVIVTLGAEGALALAGGREWRVRPPAVDVRDTTGAGDAFRSGLAAGWLELGSEAQLGDLLTFATVVAALNCRAVGAQTALPRRSELDRYL